MKLTLLQCGIVAKAGAVSLAGLFMMDMAVPQSNAPTALDRDALTVQLQNMDLTETQTQTVDAMRFEFMVDADLNDDGFLDRTELDAALTTRFSRIDRNGNGSISADDAPRYAGRDRFVKRVGVLIEARDKNDDDHLTYDEFAADAISGFEDIDGDQDGRIDLEQVRATLQQTKPRVL